MANKDLGQFLEEAKEAGELLEASKEVDLYFGLSAVLEKLEKEKRFPSVLFNNVKGSDIPVVSNVFAERERVALAFGCDMKDINSWYRSREDKIIDPVVVEEGPVQEVVMSGEDVDLYKLPIPTHNKKDAGPYITCGASVSRDPETGIRNIGIYRHQVHSKNKLGIHMSESSHILYIYSKYEAKGEDMPIAITVGHHPAFYFGIMSFVPVGTDEYGIAGSMMGEALELVRCKTVPLEVPAYAEIVIEGFVSATERKAEAPFGEFTTLYGGEHMYHVINVTAITMRRKPVFLDCFSGHLDHQLLGGIGRLSVIYKTIKMACPTVRDVHMPPSGCCRFICFVSIKKRMEGEAKNAIAAVLASDNFIKYAVIVDEDVDIFDDSAVIKAIALSLKADQDGFMIRNAKGHALDPTAKDTFIITKVGIDATRPLKDFPETVSVPGSDDIDLNEFFN